jgi:hypothetical protein
MEVAEIMKKLYKKLNNPEISLDDVLNDYAKLFESPEELLVAEDDLMEMETLAENKAELLKSKTKNETLAEDKPDQLKSQFAAQNKPELLQMKTKYESPAQNLVPIQTVNESSAQNDLDLVPIKMEDEAEGGFQICRTILNSGKTFLFRKPIKNPFFVQLTSFNEMPDKSVHVIKSTKSPNKQVKYCNRFGYFYH